MTRSIASTTRPVSLSHTGITRRAAVALLGLSTIAAALGCHAAHAEATPAQTLQTLSANLITPPDILGTLPSLCEEPREIELEDRLVIATAHYAVSLPKDLLGPSFTWEFDNTPVTTSRPSAVEGLESPTYKADCFLVVEPGNGEPSFTVYAQDQGFDTAGMPLVGNEDLWEVGDSTAGSRRRVFVRTALGENRWVKFVSAGRYAFTQREADGTRIYTPNYSVLVRDGWIDEDWCYTYNDGTAYAEGQPVHCRLDIYANKEERAAGITAMSFLSLSDNASRHLFRDDPTTWSHRYRTGYAGEIELNGTGTSLQAMSWETQAGADDWVDSWRAAELWADCASTAITQRALQEAPVATNGDLWHVETPGYSFDIPEYWRGRVQLVFEDACTLRVTPVGLPNVALVRLSLLDSSSPACDTGGDIGCGKLFGAHNDSGQYVALYGYNLPFFLHAGGWREGRVASIDPVSAEQEQEAIDLATGGAATAQEVLERGGDCYGLASDFYSQAVVPTISVVGGA